MRLRPSRPNCPDHGPPGFAGPSPKWGERGLALWFLPLREKVALREQGRMRGNLRDYRPAGKSPNQRDPSSVGLLPELVSSARGEGPIRKRTLPPGGENGHTGPHEPAPSDRRARGHAARPEGPMPPLRRRGALLSLPEGQSELPGVRSRSGAIPLRRRSGLFHHPDHRPSGDRAAAAVPGDLEGAAGYRPARDADSAGGFHPALPAAGEGGGDRPPLWAEDQARRRRPAHRRPV